MGNVQKDGCAGLFGAASCSNPVEGISPSLIDTVLSVRTRTHGITKEQT
jgi:hypothetical protein